MHLTMRSGSTTKGLPRRAFKYYGISYYICAGAWALDRPQSPDPMVFHVFNVLLHALMTIMVYR